MDLDRCVLARIDRRLLAGLDREERFQMVRVPVTPAKWSTWKRYCDAAGLSMGRAIAALIDHELASFLGDSSSGAGEERVRQWSEHLQRREHAIEVRERRVEAATKRASQPPRPEPRPAATNAVRAGRGSSTRTAPAWRPDRATLLPENPEIRDGAGSRAAPMKATTVVLALPGSNWFDWPSLVVPISEEA